MQLSVPTGRFFANAVCALIQAARRGSLDLSWLSPEHRFIVKSVLNRLNAQFVMNVLKYLASDVVPLRDMCLNMVYRVLAADNRPEIQILRATFNSTNATLGSWIRCTNFAEEDSGWRIRKSDAEMIVPQMLPERNWIREELNVIGDYPLMQNFSAIKIEGDPLWYVIFRNVEAMKSNRMLETLTITSRLDTLCDVKHSLLRFPVFPVQVSDCPLIDKALGGILRDMHCKCETFRRRPFVCLLRRD
jgi:hypothetical protein